MMKIKTKNDENENKNYLYAITFENNLEKKIHFFIIINQSIMN